MSLPPNPNRHPERSEGPPHSPLSLLLPFLFLLSATAAHAHVGSKDVFETIAAGPYRLYVTVRLPNVIPGVATIEVESYGAPIDTLQIAPTLLTGESARHPPTPDTMVRSKQDPNAYSGSLWIMSSGSWEVRFAVAGKQGTANANVAVPAVPLTVLRMQKPLGLLLAALGLVLTLGFAGVIAAAVRESRLPPGTAPTPERRRTGRIAFALGLAFAAAALWAGGKWWNVEAAGYARNVYQPAELMVSLLPAKDRGPDLLLNIEDRDNDTGKRTPVNTHRLLLDHGKVMHLYAIRWPAMDAAFHLHPIVDADGTLSETLPAMPPGTYKLFADIVRPSGFPETLTSTLTRNPGSPAEQATPLAEDDASAAPPPLAAGLLGPDYKLPDGYTLRWDAPPAIEASRAYTFHFTLLTPNGEPAKDVVPYLGMAGHAAFVKTDATVFAHTHPDGSAAMPAMMLANPGTSVDPAMNAAMNAATSPTTILSSRPKRSAVERPAVSAAIATPMSTNLSSRPERSEVERPAGSAAIATPMSTNLSSRPERSEVERPAVPSSTTTPLPATVGFPYGFPTPGRYRIFIQMKHGATVETGVFDAEVR